MKGLKLLSLIPTITIPISLTSCSKKIVEGIIKDKKYNEEYYYTTLVPIFNGTTTILIPIIHYCPEDGEFIVEMDNSKIGHLHTRFKNIGYSFNIGDGISNKSEDLLTINRYEETRKGEK